MSEAGATAVADVEIPIRVLTTGHVRPKQASRGLRRYFPGGWSGETLPVNLFAVQHPAGLCLFDAGQTAAAAQPGYFPRWHPFLRLARFELRREDEAASQLRSHGLSRPRWIVLSHLHTDHVGGLAGLDAEEVLVSRTEWERARGLGGRLRGYLPQYWPAAVQPRLVDFAGPPVGPFPASYDLAGDGTLVLLPSPGHTPGHLALLVRARAGTYLLGGDIAHSATELAAAAPAVAEFCRVEGVAFLAAHDREAARLAESPT